MRIALGAVFLVLCTFSLPSQDLESCLSEMGVALNIPANTVEVPQIEQEEVTYQLAFAFSEPKIEVRLSLFPVFYFTQETGEFDMARDFLGFSMAVLLNIAQGEQNIGYMEPLFESDAKDEYGADMGFFALLNGKHSPFSEAYEYVVVYGFCKQDSGIVYVSLLFNNASLIHQDDFFRARHCFLYTD